MVKLLIHDFLDNLVQARKVGLGNLAVRAHLDALGAQGIGYQRGKEHDRHLVRGRIFPNLAGQGMAVHFRHFDIPKLQDPQFPTLPGRELPAVWIGPGPVWKDIPRPPLPLLAVVTW